MPYCKNCGDSLLSDAAFCAKCGVWAGKGSLFCPNCRIKLHNDAAICNKCGAIINSPGYGGRAYFAHNIAVSPIVARQGSGKTFCVISLILGILAFFIPFLGVPCAISAVVFGILGYRRSKLVGLPTDIGTAGIVVGCISIFYSLIKIMVFL